MSRLGTPREVVVAKELTANLAARGAIGALLAAVLDPAADKKLLAAVSARIKQGSIFAPDLASIAKRFAREYREAAARALAALKDRRAVPPPIAALHTRIRL